MIWEELDKALIFTEVDVSGMEDLMQSMGSAYTREGYTKDSYVQALVAREKEFPTGLDVGGYGVAIPHTSVEHVNKSGVAIGILKNPVTFVQMGTDDETVEVKIVFMLAVVDPNKHIDELQQILAIIQDTSVLDRMLTAKTTEDIIEIIKEKESTL